jgi:ABC-type branched-subunit amino acid transport system ATPase component
VEFLKNFVQLPNIVNGLALMLTIVFLPGGLIALGLTGSRHRKPPKAAAGTGAAPAGTPASAAHAPGQPGELLLKVDDVSRSFGGIAALSTVDFEIRRGKIYGLIGPNGAGKTTMVNVITGLFKPTVGRIHWKGKVISKLPAFRIARGGIARTYQNIQLFGDMSVLENVIVGAHARIRTNLATTWLCLPRERREEDKAAAEAWRLLGDLGLAELANLPAGKLSYGDQRRVEIARALATQPELLLLDEPAAGMNEAETARLADFIAGLKAKGYTILVIEHHMDLIMKICDEIIVFNFGKQIAQGAPAEVSRDEAVVEAYLGRD